MRSQKGFTLIELLVVLGLMGVVAGFTLVVGMESVTHTSLQSDRSVEVTALMRVRAQALANQCFGDSCTGGRAHGVYFDTDRIVLFQSLATTPEYSHRNRAVDEIIPLERTVTRRGLKEIVFLPRVGVPVHAGEVRTVDTLGQERHITVNQNGRIDW